MTHKKLFFTLLFSFCLSLFFSMESSAASDVSIFYKNEEGKDLILEKANNISRQLDEIDAVVGTFSSDDLKILEKSSDIIVIEKERKKLQVQATAKDLTFKNNTVNWNQTLVKANKAWGIGLSGQNVKVGIIDTAIAAHSSLPTVKKKIFISDASEISTAPSAAKHGTFVAGIIAAQPTKNSKVIGISPNVTLYNMNINGKSGADLVDFIAAMDYAIQEKLQIVNISMGIPKSLLLDDGEKLVDSPLYLAVKKALNAGIIVVAASGNNGVDVDYPAAIPGVIAVGSVSSNKKISYFSNKGTSLSVVAPGSDVQSLSYAGGTLSNSGTSFAAPHVTGLIALLKQGYPTESSEKIKSRLLKSAVDLGVKGFDPVFGNGLAVFPDALLVSSENGLNETASEKFVRVNNTKIKSIIANINNGKTVNYLTEFTPLFTVKSSLTSKQKTAMNSYKIKLGVTVISSSVSSSKIKATNLTTLKTKKTSKITFSTKLKKATVNSKAISIYKNGEKFKNFTFTTSKDGSYMTLKTTKALTKGTYNVAVDTSNIRTIANGKVKPFIVQYKVK